MTPWGQQSLGLKGDSFSIDLPKNPEKEIIGFCNFSQIFSGMRELRVAFPALEGPTRATYSPALIFKEIFFKRSILKRTISRQEKQNFTWIRRGNLDKIFIDCLKEPSSNTMRRMETKSPSRANSKEMFDKISSTYDTLNHVLSFGLDFYWRNAVALRLQKEHKKILDCATGTGDQLLALAKKADPKAQLFGVDPAEQMLEIAKCKFNKTSFATRTAFSIGKADKLPFEDGFFDFISISFGIRNVENVDAALRELKRVLSPKGTLVILEFSIPSTSFVRLTHGFYLRSIVPLVGGVVAKDPLAYRYLADTIQEFPYGEKFCRLVKNAGFDACKVYPLSFGITSLYLAHPRDDMVRFSSKQPLS